MNNEGFEDESRVNKDESTRGTDEGTGNVPVEETDVVVPTGRQDVVYSTVPVDVNPTIDPAVPDRSHGLPFPIDEADSDAAAQGSCCFSWSRLCDILGNRQENFIQELRPLRKPIVITIQSMIILQLEIERGMRTITSTMASSQNVHDIIEYLNSITTAPILNIPPDENEMLRQVSSELTTLARLIDELIFIDQGGESIREERGAHTEKEPVHATAIQSVRRPRYLQKQPRTVDEKGRIQNRRWSTSPPPSSLTRAPSTQSVNAAHMEPPYIRRGLELRNSTAGGASVEEHSLKERIERDNEMLSKLIKFIDKKTERRWWLRDVINFLQLFVKLALFISASISVVYHQEQVAPIITLVFTVAQGIIEVLDQYFLKNQQPEDIKLHIITTLSATGSKI